MEDTHNGPIGVACSKHRLNVVVRDRRPAFDGHLEAREKAAIATEHEMVECPRCACETCERDHLVVVQIRKYR